MQTKDKIYLSVILVVIVLACLGKCADNRQANKSALDIINYKTEAQEYKTKLGLKINTNVALPISTQEQIKSLLASNDTLKQWMSKFKEIKGGIVVKETTIVREVQVPFDRPIPCDFKPFTANKISRDFLFYTTVANTGLTIDSLKIPNTATILIGERRVGLFKDDGFMKLKSKLVVDVNNTNPYIQTSNISGYTYEPKKKWYERPVVNFSIGIGLGALLNQFGAQGVNALIGRIR